MRILLLIDNERDRSLVAAWLAGRYEVLLPSDEPLPAAPFDLGIVDGPALRRLGAQIRARKRQEEPVFLPFFLISTPESLGPEAAQLRETVDEFISQPASQIEFETRLEILLRTRRLSLQLEQQRQESERLTGEIEAQRRLLQNIIDHAPAAIVVVRGPDLVFEIVNPAAQALLPGISPLGKTVAEVSPLSAPRVLPILRRILATGQSYQAADMPLPVRRAPGAPPEERYFTVTVVSLRLREAGVDALLALAVETSEQVHARRRVEELAAEAQRRAAELDTILMALPDGLIIGDSAGRIVRLNARAAELTGFGPGDLSRSMAERLQLLHVETPDGRPLRAEDLPGMRALRGETVHEETLLVRRPDSQVLWLSSSSAPIRAPDGRILGAVTTLSDITPLHRLQEETRRLLEAERRARGEAEAAVRARDEFLAAAAHELKTPLTSLRGFAQFALRRLEREGQLRPEQLQRTLRVIDHQSDRLSRLVAQLLDLSSLDAGQLALKRRVTDVAALVRDAVASAQAATQRHRFVVRAPPSLEAFVDPARMEQVIDNLLDNAAKFSPEDTPIEVELSAADPRMLRLTVRDYGPGIPPERRGGLFSRFYQAQTGRPFAGLGLGLYLSRQLVRLHGGHLEAEFPPEGGMRLIITLPRGLNDARRWPEDEQDGP